MKVDEMKVKDLPQILQNFLQRIGCADSESRINLIWLHNSCDWTKATNEERLAYAELMYKKGVGINYLDRGFALIIGEVYNPHDDLIAVLTDHKERGGNLNQFYPIYIDGKWAQIISRPEPKPKYEFKVGDRPHWNKEMIEALPHGTVSECAVTGKSFDYNGENAKEFTADDNSLYIESPKNGGYNFLYFTNNTHNRYAKILSLPTQDEFKAGEMVDVWNKDNEADIQPVKYRFFAEGKHWVETCAVDIVVNFNNIRKIQPDPDKVFKDAADKLLLKHDWVTHDLAYEDTKSMLIEALKKGQTL